MRGNESEVSKYELSDALVANVVGAAETGAVEAHLIAALISDLKPQIPIPTPPMVGAVVRTSGFPSAFAPAPASFIRWATDHHTTSPWIEAGDHEQPYRTDEIGRITEVLSEGVDL